MLIRLRGLVLPALIGVVLALQPLSSQAAREDLSARRTAPCIDDLESLTVEALRRETWQGRLAVAALAPRLDREQSDEAHAAAAAPEAPAPPAVLLSLVSDQLRQYARLDLPAAPPPATGHPLVVFIHGWIGRDAAPGYALGARPESMYRDLILRLTGAGFAVLSPGLRGHGTVQDIPAEGIEFLEAWDTGSYLSPVFYARDVLNLLSALPALNTRLAADGRTATLPAVNTAGVAMTAHSQGGDVLLTTLAVSGSNPRVATPVLAASIWSGNIADRFSQAETFGPMGSTVQAFIAGDGHWTGSAKGRDGTVNPDFVFPWPSHTIGTPDPTSSEWSWQAERWSTPTVREAIEQKYSEMYDTINRYVGNIDDATFSVARDSSGKLLVKHDRRIADVMPRIGGFNQERYLVQPLNLHFSDRDYYSLPSWNKTLANHIQARGGQAEAYEYAGTTHSLRISEHAWFSPPGTRDGVGIAMQRDIALFRRVLSDPTAP
jgi:dienelactone hydrolase